MTIWLNGCKGPMRYVAKHAPFGAFDVAFKDQVAGKGQVERGFAPVPVDQVGQGLQPFGRVGSRADAKAFPSASGGSRTPPVR